MLETNELFSKKMKIKHYSPLVVVKYINDVEFKFSHIPAGELCPESKVSHKDKPDKIKIKHDLLMGQTPVTQAQWTSFMRYRRSQFKGDQRPVDNVRWYDCIQFCNALSIAESLTPVYHITQFGKDDIRISRILNTNGYRLPIEEEWEYSAKAGTELSYVGSNQIDDVAWYGCKARETQDVAQKKPNSWGLYDMSGNIWEWCDRTPKTGDSRVKEYITILRMTRGGSW